MFLLFFETKKEEEVIINLNDFISHFGPPENLQCDNGPEFINEKFKKYYFIFNMNIIRSKPRHPQTNCFVERLHRNIKKNFIC